jgi:hypothetical protein
MDEWISELTKRKLTVKAKAGLKAIAIHQGKTFDSQAPPRPTYSPELFVDTLVDFVVATDQVFIYFFIFFCYIKYLSLVS